MNQDNESSLLATVVSLSAQGLHDSAVLMASFLMEKPAPSVECLSAFAEALFGAEEYGRAKWYFEMCLSAIDDGPEESLIGSSGRMDRNHILSRLGECFFRLNQYREAVDNFTRIPESKRTAIVNERIGTICLRLGDAAAASKAFFACLAQVPNSVVSSVGLRRCHVPEEQVLELTRSRFLSMFSSALSAAHVGNHSGGLARVNALHAGFPRNGLLIATEAWIHFEEGLIEKSRRLFEEAIRVDPTIVCEMDIFGAILRADEDLPRLNSLVQRLLSVAPTCPETWVCAAYVVELLGRMPSAFALVDKAIMMSPWHANAHVYKGTLLLAVGDITSAAGEFQRALKIAPSISAFQGLTETHRKANRISEALEVAKEANERLPSNARAIVLLAQVLVGVEEGRAKARELFDKVLNLHEECDDAVLGLVSLFWAEMKFDEAIFLLKRQLEKNVSPLLHTRLADTYVLKEDFAAALQHFHAALSIKPNFRAAISGLRSLSIVMGGGRADTSEDEEDGNNDTFDEII